MGILIPDISITEKVVRSVVLLIISCGTSGTPFSRKTGT